MLGKVVGVQRQVGIDALSRQIEELSKKIDALTPPPASYTERLRRSS